MTGATEPRAVCGRCRRPRVVCWCVGLRPIRSRTRVVILQHPRERRVRVSTGWMTHVALSGSELHRGLRFGEHRRVRVLAATGAALLYPGPGAVAPAAFQAAPPRTLIVLDGTWSTARKLLALNPFLETLPRIGFEPLVPSRYHRVRREPAAHCVSTIEAVAHVLGELEGERERFDGLLEPLRRLVAGQVAHHALAEEP